MNMRVIDKILLCIKNKDFSKINKILIKHPQIKKCKVSFLIMLLKYYKIVKISKRNQKILNIRSQKLLSESCSIIKKNMTGNVLNSKKFSNFNLKNESAVNFFSKNVFLVYKHQIPHRPSLSTRLMADNSKYTEILKKHATNDTSLDKIINIFFDAFRNALPECDLNKAAKVARELTISLHNSNRITDKKFIASKKLNISNPKNKSLCQDVYEGRISATDFLNMTPEQMKSKELKQLEEKMLYDNICDIQGPKLQAETTMFKCGKCGQRKTTYYQLQTRSADEPMTNFVTCVVCGNRWKFC